MNNVINEMLSFFGINTVPTDFPTFIYWIFSLVFGLYFVKFSVSIVFEFVKSMARITDK